MFIAAMAKTYEEATSNPICLLKLTSNLNWLHCCLIDCDGFLRNRRDLLHPCLLSRNALVCSILLRRLCSALTPPYLGMNKRQQIKYARYAYTYISTSSCICMCALWSTNLERCCGKHNWFGLPDARLPGVLTDCDRLWCGEPYLGKAVETLSSSQRSLERCPHLPHFEISQLLQC